MSGNLATIAAYNTRLEADFARYRMEGAGVPVFLADEAMVGWFWHYGNLLGGIKLQVPEADWTPALEVLAGGEDEPSDAGSEPADAQPPRCWSCPKCRAEVDADMEFCWACGTTAGGVEDADFEVATAPSIRMTEDPPLPMWWGIAFVICPPLLIVLLVPKFFFALPWPSSCIQGERASPEDRLDSELDRALRRACMAAMLSTVSLPVLLNLYSIWLILKHGLLATRVLRRAGWLICSAMAINILLLQLFFLLWIRVGLP